MIGEEFLRLDLATKAAIKAYNDMKRVLDTTPESVQAAYDRMEGPMGARLSEVPVSHNTGPADARLADGVDAIDAARERYKKARAYMDWFDPAWQVLSDEERQVLAAFYQQGSLKPGATDHLAGELKYSPRTVDRIRQGALQRMQRFLYW